MFRTTIMFKSFQPKGKGDRVHVYLVVYMHKILDNLKRQKITDRAGAEKIVADLVKEPVPLPSDQTFFMRQLGLISQTNPGESKKMQDYLKQLKEVCGQRFLDTIFNYNGMDFKFWLVFSAKPFLGHKFNKQM